LVLLQGSIKTIIVVSYLKNKDYISTVLCENKNKPQMHCEGKCHLKKQLDKEEQNTTDLATILKNVEVAAPCLHNHLTINGEFEISLRKHQFIYLLNEYDCLQKTPFQPPCLLC
jgi:hypothetical protein